VSQQYLTTTVTPPGSGAISPTSNWFSYGQSVPVTATPNPGYTFTGFSGALSGPANPQSLIMNASKSVTANFAQSVSGDYEINAPESACLPSGGGGSFIAYAASLNGFSSTVSLASAATGGLSSTVTPDPDANNWINVGAGVITLDAQATAPGDYSAVITENGVGIQHQKSIAVNVKPAPSPVTQIAYPSALQTNIGWVPLDMYDYAHSPSQVGTPLAVSCPGAATVRTCYQAAFANFQSQHVTGVRFIFLLCGGFSPNTSVTPLHGCGNSWQQVTSPNPNGLGDATDPWMQNLRAFFQDLYDRHLYNVTPTMVHSDQTGSRLMAPGPAPDGRGCRNQPTELLFLPGEPYGRDPGTYNPYVGPDNWSAYNCSPSNPIFVGWQNLDNVAAAVIRNANSLGLNLFEFDVEQELNPTSFPVQARFIYDNAHGQSGCNVTIDSLCYHDDLTAVETIMSQYFPSNPGRVTWSAPDIHRQSTGADCGDVYGGYARLIHLDEITQVINGGYFGMPFNASPMYGLTCGGYLCSDGSNNVDTCTADRGYQLMARSPLYHSQPKIVDLHTYPCIENSGGCFTDDASASVEEDAKNVFNAVSYYLGPNMINNQSAIFMVGETHTTANNGCTADAACTPISCTSTCNLHAPLDAAWLTVKGYNESNLGVAHQNVVFRPFINLPGADNCYFQPANQRLNPNNQGPFTPSQQQ
jgi:hypothetical protein